MDCNVEIFDANNFMCTSTIYNGNRYMQVELHTHKNLESVVEKIIELIAAAEEKEIYVRDSSFNEEFMELLLSKGFSLVFSDWYYIVNNFTLYKKHGVYFMYKGEK
jgi:hypothetical protein